MSIATQGSSIAVRVDETTVALGVVAVVHDDGTVDGLMYAPGAAPTSFSGLQVGDVASAVIGAAWSPPDGLT
ncbi:hypothetical protein B0G80_0410 [Paraburkholderia sp. BL6669N2]|uniref:hypothetical protein n=1 Tax=Paraburkholderia sp. BL6669N2 TaxID=1938807 RepID=UPI000E252685|nr:hypothetical protein [Paraburkholderia sp. BL6669N2]REG57776.1 hypothetical protein B0G80_0410 [Paraburkholderia sp. BL6669N2]